MKSLLLKITILFPIIGPKLKLQTNQTNQMIAISGLLVVVLCSLAFYFFYWTKTPQYSINLIREAVKTHNTEMFEQYVDLDNLIACYLYPLLFHILFLLWITIFFSFKETNLISVLKKIKSWTEVLQMKLLQFSFFNEMNSQTNVTYA